MFVNSYANDLWFAFSAKDAIEVGLWDRSENPIGWETLHQSKSYTTVTVATYDARNIPITYSYQELNPDFILHNTEQVLVNPSQEVTQSFNVPSGSYFITYNCTREMAGSPIEPLVIQDISPSRKELKLLPFGKADNSYVAFCQKKLLMQDVSALYLRSVADCPYGKIYTTVSPHYTNEINTIKSVFFITSDGGMLTFFQNLYEDLLLYTSTPSAMGVGGVSRNLIRIQGIQTYFNNYLLQNTDAIVSFEDIDAHFRGFVSASIERKFAPVGPHPIQPYVDAKAFVYDFFTKYFYDTITATLTSTYNDKYYSYFKNALNVGGNRLFPILNTGMVDERQNPTDPLTLLVKLKDELPNDFTTQTKCWVSNISLSPYIIRAIIKSPTEGKVYKIGAPNFSIPIPNASLTNTNIAYTANDLKNDDETDRELTVSKNITELSVDYTNFSNFVVFSSAEMRLKIFKNKIISLTGLSASLSTLEVRGQDFLLKSGSVYPYYAKEYASIQGQMTDIINSFDGYESYLYRGGSYAYANSRFISASYVAEQDTSASAYDVNNRDSLLNNTPQHILADQDNDDYIIFLSMVGHFFDNLYIYIAGLPSEKTAMADQTTEFTRRVVDYMLETFGWTLDDSLEQSNILNNYLTSEQIEGLNQMSAEDRLKAIRNRVLANLSGIYKAKGAEEAVQLIMACYGIPLVLLSIREYGGVAYDNQAAAYTLYERVYMRQWDTSSVHDSYYLQSPSGSHTYLFKIRMEDAAPYAYGKEQVLFGRVETNNPSSESGSGEWAVGFERVAKHNTGKIVFRIGYKHQPLFKLYSQEFPLFDGNIYSVMLRRNLPDPSFEFDPNQDAVPAKYDLYVKRNEFGNQIVNLTASAICYDISASLYFSQGGQINIGGWFYETNGQGFIGAFDKFQVWRDALPDANLEDYTNNFSAYSYRGTTIPYQSLMFRMHTDYPFNQLDSGIWRNGNPYLAVSSSAKLNQLYSEPHCNVDYMISYMPWSGSTKIVDGLCGPESQSTYPYQFIAMDYPSTWGISKYGPNKFRNQKVRHASQSVEARFDDLARSTYVQPGTVAPDSTQVGFFVDPQDFKNRDIVRYFGNFDFMDAIGDPMYQYSQSYDSLRAFRHEYSANRIEYSGSRTLFNELCILYKLYFNRSVFESIKNVIPARTNAIIGVVIEPTILERPKYQFKPIETSASYALETTMGHYAPQTCSALVGISASIVESGSMDLDLTYLADPTADYPANYGGNVINDTAGMYEFSHFAAGVPPRIIDFVATPLEGWAELAVQFTNLSFGASTYYWDFGDGQTAIAEGMESTDANPIHIYATPGLYTVTLWGYYGAYGLQKKRVNYIKVNQYPITADFDANPKFGNAPLEVSFSNLSYNATAFSWSFGSGSEATNSLAPTFSYNDPGIYSVGLTAYAFSPGTNPKTAQHVSLSYISVSMASLPIGACVGPYMTAFEGGWDGVKSYLDTTNYSLGVQQGPVTFSYNVPNNYSASRFIVQIGPTTYLDTKWLTKNVDAATVEAINMGMLAYAPPPIGISASLADLVPIDSSGTGSIYWNKTTAQNVVTVKFYNPFEMTSSFTMSCVTTPPPPPSSPCGGQISPSGHQAAYPYYTDFPISLGTGNGTVVLNFQAFTVPDRFQVIYDGNVVIDTYFRGSTASIYRTQLNNKGFAAIPIISPGSGVASFYKNSYTSYAILRVYSPLAGTAWNCTLACPV